MLLIFKIFQNLKMYTTKDIYFRDLSTLPNTWDKYCLLLCLNVRTFKIFREWT
jgi:hypothetical protein